ncbi:LAFE_0H15962g1_1 [Lachancea fermentati]|uniref:LAFE_0H15962g1_1 n=1 Tax=Lachancea fermentati TaxID=4955 RepID=A0A1G4ML41_LACFM|nr:LAFE_0H15962g1_1 [Lachancea fermentati]
MASHRASFEILDSSLEDLSLSRSMTTNSESSETDSNDEKRYSGSIQSKTAGMKKEYSADIAPLKFKMSKPVLNVVDLNGHNDHLDNFKFDKGSFSERNYLSDGERTLKSTVFDTINREEFEKYLKEPAYIKFFKKKRNIKQFRRLFLAQELKVDADYINSSTATLSSLNESNGRAVWAMKFSADGRYLATGGKDCALRIWKVISSPMERGELNNTAAKPQAKQISLKNASLQYGSREDLSKVADNSEEYLNLYAPVFHPFPFRSYLEHKQDILDLDWSKNNFIITASMDKTVRLWHYDRKTSLKSFAHPDFVTCAKFHPNDDRFFISGCLDHTCRLWSILDHKVSFEYYCGDLITAVDISPNDGKYTVVGTFNGFVFVLLTRGLELVYSFHVLEKVSGNTATRATEHGPKITGLEFFKPQDSSELRLMITSNDSRIRIFSIKDRKLLEVLRGFENVSSQISAHLMSLPNGVQVAIAPSENHWIYCWKLMSSDPKQKENKEELPSNSSVKRSGSIRSLLRRSLSIGSNHSDERKSMHALHHPHLHLPHAHHCHKTDQPIKNSSYVAFHAHHVNVTAAVVASPGTAKTLALSNDFICELTMAFSETDEDVAIMRPVDNKKYRRRSLIRGVSDENSDGTMHGTSPSMIDSIGTILVSCDVSGMIRVFRTDLSTNVRKKVLHALESEESTHKANIVIDSHDPCHTVSMLGNGMRAGLSKSKAFTSSPSVRSYRSQVSSGDTTAESSNQIKCDVCGSNSIHIAKPKGVLSTESPNYYCSDCGNQINRFK